MGRRYSVPLTSEAHSAAGDILEAIAASTKSLKLIEFRLDQSTEAGDSESEQVRVSIKVAEGAYTSGSGGSSVTPAPLNRADAAADFTAEKANTTDAAAGSGSITTVKPFAFNVHAGLHYLPTPECQISVEATDAFLFTLDAAPADSITFHGYAVFEEE